MEAALVGVRPRTRLSGHDDEGNRVGVLAPLPAPADDDGCLRGIELEPRGGLRRITTTTTTTSQPMSSMQHRRSEGRAANGVSLQRNEEDKICIAYSVPRALVSSMHEESLRLTRRDQRRARGVDAMWELRTDASFEPTRLRATRGDEDDDGDSVGVSGDDADDVQLAVAHADGKHLHLSWLYAAGGAISSRESVSERADLMPHGADSAVLCRARAGIEWGKTLCAVQSPRQTAVYVASASATAQDGEPEMRRELSTTSTVLNTGVAWNPSRGGEFATLDSSGRVSLFELERLGTATTTADMDGGRGRERHGRASSADATSWLDCIYGPNSSRSILALASDGVYLYDSRARATSRSPVITAPMPSRPTEPRAFFVSIASPAPFACDDNFPLAVATTTAIHAFDMRQPASALLSWVHVMQRTHMGERGRRPPHMQLHFRDNCTGGDRWLDKIFAPNEDLSTHGRLCGAVTLADVYSESLTMQFDFDAVVDPVDEPVSMSSCFYMPLFSEAAVLGTGPRTLEPPKLKWDAARVPVKLWSSESSRWSGGCCVIGSSPSANEDVWGDVAFVTCDSHGNAWLQRLGDAAASARTNDADLDDDALVRDAGLTPADNGNEPSRRDVSEPPMSEREEVNTVCETTGGAWPMTRREVYAHGRRIRDAAQEDINAVAVPSGVLSSVHPGSIHPVPIRVRDSRAPRYDGASSSSAIVGATTRRRDALTVSASSDSDDALDRTLLLVGTREIHDVDLATHHADVMRLRSGPAVAGALRLDHSGFEDNEDLELLRKKWWFTTDQ